MRFVLIEEWGSGGVGVRRSGGQAQLFDFLSDKNNILW